MDNLNGNQNFRNYVFIIIQFLMQSHLINLFLVVTIGQMLKKCSKIYLKLKKHEG